MAAPLASPGHRSRFEQEQDRAVRALVRSVTGLPEEEEEEDEEELGGGRFQAALNFAWSNFRSAPRHPPPAPGAKLGGCDGPAVPRQQRRLGASERGLSAPSPAGAARRRRGKELPAGPAPARPLPWGTAVCCDPLSPARLAARRGPCGCGGVVQGRVLSYPP